MARQWLAAALAIPALVLFGCSQKQTVQAGNAATKAGRQAGNALEQAGAVLNDAAITARVKGAMQASSRLDTSGIDVDTKGRVVYLKGTVPNAAQHRLALAIAKDTVGANTRIVDQLRVGTKPARSGSH